MKVKRSSEIVTSLCFILVQIPYLAGAKSGQILLKDVHALTLHHGQMTNARRSSPVPQLKCVGGTAGCSFKPETVQCINRGSDGYDVQWECKTDMDNSYRFGKLEVTCEGYDYPEDPYILKGSCGLEYTLDFTQEGYERKNSGGYHGNQRDDSYHDRSQYTSGKSSSILQDLVYLGIVAGIIYIVYKSCIASNNTFTDQPPPYDSTFRPPGHGGNQQQPPPPSYGFRDEYMPNNGGSCSSGAGYSGSQTYTPPPAGGSTGGGFWSGAFTGGILGYMFGNRNNYGNGYGYQRPYTGWGGRRGWGSGWGSGWGTGFGSGWGSGGSRTHTTTSRSSGGFSSAPRSSGTRTASGFASTSRR